LASPDRHGPEGGALMARPNLDRHPKFRRLCVLLGAPRSHCRGYLELLWDTAYENGDPVIGDATDVRLACDYPGDAEQVVNALMNAGAGSSRAGFIEEVPGQPGTYQVHDLYDNAPRYVRRHMECEAQRRADGVTISQLRAEAGRKGGFAKAAQASKRL